MSSETPEEYQARKGKIKALMMKFMRENRIRLNDYMAFTAHIEQIYYLIQDAGLLRPGETLAKFEQAYVARYMENSFDELREFFR